MQLQDYVIDEDSIVNKTDAKHIENYKNLKEFLEMSIIEAMIEGKHGYRKLSSMIFDCVRNLDMLINTYELELSKARGNNELLRKLFEAMKEESENNEEDDKKK